MTAQPLIPPPSKSGDIRPLKPTPSPATHPPPHKAVRLSQREADPRRVPRAPRGAHKPGPAPPPQRRPEGEADGSHQVQRGIDLQGLLQGAPSDLQEGDQAGRVPSVADLVAVMRDGLAEGRHDEKRGGARRGPARAREERHRHPTAGLSPGRQLDVRNGGERSHEQGYSGPESSDVERSAYRSSRGRGEHAGAGRDGARALPRRVCACARPQNPARVCKRGLQSAVE